MLVDRQPDKSRYSADLPTVSDDSDPSVSMTRTASKTVPWFPKVTTGSLASNTYY